MFSPRKAIPALAVFAVGLSTVLPNTALARRHPTKRERAAIARAMHVPPQCALIWVSTVDPTWARAEDSAQGVCLKYTANGIAILHRTRARWHPVIEFSDIRCPVPNVPARIVKDLHVRCNPGDGAQTTQNHTCHHVAHNEHMEATDLPCWDADEYVLGARERFYDVNWHGQDFKLYGFWCKVVNEFKQPRSTWYFNCERGKKYANFTWTFEQ
jgi:hypothetical protein